MIAAVFDWLLVGLVVWLGWRSVSEADAFRAVVHFIALGLSLALIWLRLSAPDLALAEAAVGSGLTGALLLSAARRQRRPDERVPGERGGASR